MSTDTGMQSEQDRLKALIRLMSPGSIFSASASWPAELSLIASGLAALFVGTAVYFVDRDWSTVLFLAPFTELAPTRSNIFGPLGGSLPALVHSFAIPVLVLVALSPWPRSRSWVCLAWFGLAAGLEGLQSDAAATWLPAVGSLPGKSVFFEYVEAYARQGRFDAVDLIATGVGCSIAFAVSFSVTPHGRRRSA